MLQDLRSHRLGLLGPAALLVWLWVLIRAQVQSITIDEAESYLIWAHNPNPVHWIAASNNHVLNSMLMRLSTSIFGISHLAVRVPALIAAGIYILVSLSLCLAITRKKWQQLVLFALLTINPMVLDYLVAARGYGMALAFLLGAIYLLLSHLSETPDNRYLRLCGISCCLALSFASNFSFAWVCVAVFALTAFYIKPRTRHAILLLIVPGVMLSLVLSAYPAAHIERSQLWFGARSLGRTFASVRDAVISTPNLNLLNPWLMSGVVPLGRKVLVPAMLLGMVAIFAVMVAGSGSAHRVNVRRMSCLWAILSVTIVFHYATFRMFKVLLPVERTAIFMVPIAMLLCGIAASCRARR